MHQEATFRCLEMKLAPSSVASRQPNQVYGNSNPDTTYQKVDPEQGNEKEDRNQQAGPKQQDRLNLGVRGKPPVFKKW